MIAGGPERRLSARPLWLPAKTGGWGEGGAMLDPFGGVRESRCFCWLFGGGGGDGGKIEGQSLDTKWC